MSEEELTLELEKQKEQIDVLHKQVFILAGHLVKVAAKTEVANDDVLFDIHLDEALLEVEP